MSNVIGIPKPVMFQEIDDCVPSDHKSVKGNPWNDRAGFCWILKNPEACEFRPYKGQLRIFEVKDE